MRIFKNVRIMITKYLPFFPGPRSDQGQPPAVRPRDVTTQRDATAHHGCIRPQRTGAGNSGKVRERGTEETGEEERSEPVLRKRVNTIWFFRTKMFFTTKKS